MVNSIDPRVLILCFCQTWVNRICSPDGIILFGSCAKGEDTETSDLDLYIQSSEIKLDLGKFEKELHRRIQLFFSERIEKIPKELRNNILNGIKLDGYIKVF
ncbi:MAG: nucleotidyltransferase domain-containing protein [Candidatus Woesearchaeota archaeon]